MVRSTFALKAAALLLIAVSASANDALTPQQETLEEVEFLSSYGLDEQGHGRKLGFFDFGWNWNMLMFELHICPCRHEDGKSMAPGPLCPVDDQCRPKMGPGRPNNRTIERCGCSGYFVEGVWVTDDSDQASDGSSSTSSNEENKSVGGASVRSNWWMYVVGAATVGLVGAAIIMRKRRNAEAEDGLDSDVSLSGAVSRRAALLTGGGAAAAGAGAASPAFLSVPSFRKAPSGLEVDADGAIVEPSSSSYMDMDNHVDPSQLPEGVEVSPSGNLEPYHSGSMA